MRIALKVLGEKAVAVLPAGCMSAVGFNFPQLCFSNNAIISTFAGTASMLTGIEAGLRAQGITGFRAVGFAGDGGTADIGLQALSGAIDPNSEIVVTCGSTEAMMAAIMTVTNPGDKVIVFSPFYENYGADTILSGAEQIYVPLYPPEFNFDADELEAAFRQNPKALILCNPSNPCGKVFTYDELKMIADLAEKYDAYVITDEVYEHIVYESNRHIYFSSLPNMAQRTISCSSLSSVLKGIGRFENQAHNSAGRILCSA